MIKRDDFRKGKGQRHQSLTFHIKADTVEFWPGRGLRGGSKREILQWGKSKSWWQHEEWDKEVWRLPSENCGIKQARKKSLFSERLSTLGREVSLLHASAALLRAIRCTTCLRGATTNRGGATSGFLLASVSPTSFKGQTRKPQSLLLTKASPARPFLTSAPAPPSFFQPQGTPAPPASLGPGPLRSKVASPPDPEPRGRKRGSLARGPALSPSRALAGPESGSAEVARPATPALSPEAQPQSPPGRPDCTICVPSGGGEG